MVFLGADHGGLVLKDKAKQWITDLGMEVQDLGATELVPGDDYPDYAKAVTAQVLENPLNRGILFCKSGGGMTIVANKVHGIRAVNVFDEASARQAREHLDANVMALGANWVSEEDARKAIETFLTTMFDENEERHKRRIEKFETS
jgi:RpiB/LacA/LacB family sugar-phosphate isomerase